VAMAARLWTALLMLAAVFAMHGLQCTSAADGSHTAGGRDARRLCHIDRIRGG
jgi:hypothetical protein